MKLLSLYAKGAFMVKNTVKISFLAWLALLLFVFASCGGKEEKERARVEKEREVAKEDSLTIPPNKNVLLSFICLTKDSIHYREFCANNPNPIDSKTKMKIDSICGGIDNEEHQFAKTCIFLGKYKPGTDK
jgi:hypothetical protein